MKLFRGREAIVFFFILLLLVVMFFTTPFILQMDTSGEKVINLSAFRLLIDNYAYAYIAAVGMTLVIVSGQIDLSIGSALACLAVLSAFCSLHLSIILTVLITIAAGAVIGMVSGGIVAKGRIHPLMVTLGMMIILRGIVVGFVQHEWVYVGDAYKSWGSSTVLGIPVPTFIAILVTILAILWVNNTRMGRKIYAVGSNPEAARLSGIRVPYIQFMALFLNGLLMGLAAVAYAPRFHAIQNNIAFGFELLVISAVVIGGTSIFGGSGSIIGSILGVMLISLVRSAMVYFHVPGIWEQAVYGAALLLTVSIDILRTRQRIFTGGLRWTK